MPLEHWVFEVQQALQEPLSISRRLLVSCCTAEACEAMHKCIASMSMRCPKMSDVMTKVCLIETAFHPLALCSWVEVYEMTEINPHAHTLKHTDGSSFLHFLAF